MKTATLLLISLLTLTGGCRSHNAAQNRQSLTQARRGFTTHLTTQKKTPDAVPQPPAETGIQLVRYTAPRGSFPAYVATVPGGGRHPAIIWVAGGFDNSLGDTPWAPATPDNDQSARAFGEAGIVTLYPSLRGGNNNPGYIEGLYGEVDDVIAARNYLASRPDVDPHRIYLGGHSTGGTLALLIAESDGPFRAVFAFGPIDEIAHYEPDNLPFDVENSKEAELRSPIFYLSAIKRPTFVMEGAKSPGNHEPLHALAGGNANPLVHLYDLPGEDHFSELAPITPLVARAIAADAGPTVHIDFAPNAAQMVPIKP